MNPIEWITVDKSVNSRELSTKMPSLGCGGMHGKGGVEAVLLSCRSRLPDLLRRLCKYIRVGVCMSCPRSSSYFDDARATARALGTGVFRSTVNCHSPAILTVSDAFANE